MPGKSVTESGGRRTSRFLRECRRSGAWPQSSRHIHVGERTDRWEQPQRQLRVSLERGGDDFAPPVLPRPRIPGDNGPPERPELISNILTFLDNSLPLLDYYYIMIILSCVIYVGGTYDTCDSTPRFEETGRNYLSRGGALAESHFMLSRLAVDPAGEIKAGADTPAKY